LPNTLAHLGLQGLATRGVVRNADPRWIFLGAIIPDFPAIMKRVVTAIVPGVNPLDLRAYSIAQSSLMSCLLLAAALAGFSEKPKRAFVILALNSVLHLLLDAIQIKWGNGVNLIAPLSWEPLNFGLFWPDSWPTYVITVWGLVYVVAISRRFKGIGVGLRWPQGRAAMLVTVLLGVYLAFPFSQFSAIEAADAHSIATIRSPCEGCDVAFDRVYYSRAVDGDVLRTWANREHLVRGEQLDHSATVSVRGVFQDSSAIFIEDLHEHTGLPRDLASYMGLVLVLWVWGRAVRKPVRQQGREPG